MGVVVKVAQCKCGGIIKFACDENGFVNKQSTMTEFRKLSKEGYKIFDTDLETARSMEMCFDECDGPKEKIEEAASEEKPLVSSGFITMKSKAMDMDFD